MTEEGLRASMQWHHGYLRIAQRRCRDRTATASTWYLTAGGRSSLSAVTATARPLLVPYLTVRPTTRSTATGPSVHSQYSAAHELQLGHVFILEIRIEITIEDLLFPRANDEPDKDPDSQGVPRFSPPANSQPHGRQRSPSGREYHGEGQNAHCGEARSAQAGYCGQPQKATCRLLLVLLFRSYLSASPFLTYLLHARHTHSPSSMRFRIRLKRFLPKVMATPRRLGVGEDT